VSTLSNLSSWQHVRLDKSATMAGDSRPRRFRTSFSAFGAEGWHKLIQPHPRADGQKWRRPSKRIFSTSSAASAGNASVPSSSVTPHAPSTTNTASSPSSQGPSAAKLVRNTLVGFGERLHLRKKEAKTPNLSLHKAVTLGTDTVDSEEKSFFGGLGLGLLGSFSKEKTEEVKTPAASPTTSLAPTDADGEKAEPLFENVVRSLANYSLSTSPDGAFPSFSSCLLALSDTSTSLCCCMQSSTLRHTSFSA
jgi:hypothetical protein